MSGLDERALARRLRMAAFPRFASARDLARACGAHEGSVRDWLNGRRTPNAAGLRALCEATGASADWLLGLDERGEPWAGTR